MERKNLLIMGYMKSSASKVIGHDVSVSRALNCFPFTSLWNLMSNESLDELVRRLTLSQQQLKEKCEANIAESKKIVEHSRKLIEQIYLILNKAESVKKP